MSRPRFHSVLALVATLAGWVWASPPAPIHLAASEVDYFGASVPADYLSQPLLLEVHAAEETRGLATGKGTVVALIDSGVDQLNPVLQPSLLAGFNFLDHSFSGSEYADLRHENCAAPSRSVTAATARLQEFAALPVSGDDSTAAVLAALKTILVCNPAFGHGTAVAGLIHLIAPAAKILPLKAFGPDGNADPAAIAAAILFAAARHVDVINLSFSAVAVTPEIRAAIHAATAQGIVVVAAAGNSNSSAEVFPAALPEVVAVGAVDGAVWPSLFSRAPFTNFDLPGNIVDADVAAPGVALFTTFPGFGRVWARVSGTSFSAPIVAGEAALLAELGASGARARNLIEATSDPSIAGDQQGELGHGLVQILAALRLARH